MKRNDLTHFELEREGEKLVLKKNIDSEALAGLLAGYRAQAAVAAPAPAARAASVDHESGAPVATSAEPPQPGDPRRDARGRAQ